MLAPTSEDPAGAGTLHDAFDEIALRLEICVGVMGATYRVRAPVRMALLDASCQSLHGLAQTLQRMREDETGLLEIVLAAARRNRAGVRAAAPAPPRAAASAT